MSLPPPSPANVGRFRDLIAERLGLQFDESKFNMLARVLAAHGGSDHGEFLARLALTEAGPAPAPLLHQLAPDLTVTETYFFRNAEQIRAYAELALPACQQRKPPGAPVRILSAGCASGEEPYTLAIAARELAGLGAGSVDIRAIDANPAMLAKAANARYSSWALRELSPDMLSRWFTRDGEACVLRDTVRQAVRFSMHNLATEDPVLWAEDSYDIVFCRNVLMYFSPAHAQAAVARIARALAPGGYLFLGHAETLRGLSNDFHLCHTHGTFYYQRKAHLGAPLTQHEWDALAGTVASGQPQPNAPVRAGLAVSDGAWMDAIARASHRINTLAEAPPETAVVRPNASGPDLHRAIAALHSQQFAQSLAHIDSLGSEHTLDPDVLLLKAVSLSQSGALQEAVQVCSRLLAIDELNAGANYVLALCREESGDVEGALRLYRSAAYLDTGFAMARLHIGLLERRSGDNDAARHDLQQALVLLQHEDASRLLLFGGGFARNALLALCQAELLALGGAP